MEREEASGGARTRETNPPALSIATWNVEWRKSASADATLIRERLSATDPAILCITEGYADFFGGQGHMITGGEDWGYPLVTGRRKVMLWSSTPWRNIDIEGSVDMPTGRYVAATTDTVLGPLRVIGVCIPWAGAPVASGRRDRTQWQDHGAFLVALGEIIPKATLPVVVLGDFNQCHPRRRQPQVVHDLLSRNVLDGLSLATGGKIDGGDVQAIDHIAHSKDFEAGSFSTLSNVGPNGKMLSDHFGVAVRLTLNPPTDETSSKG